MLWSVGAWCCGVDVPSPSNPLSVSCQRCITTLKVAWRRWKKPVRYEVFWNVRNEESGHLKLRFGVALDLYRIRYLTVSLQFFRWVWLRCQAPYLQTSRENSSLLSNKPRLTWQWILKVRYLQNPTKWFCAMAVRCSSNILFGNIWHICEGAHLIPKNPPSWAKAAALVQSSLLPGKK